MFRLQETTTGVSVVLDQTHLTDTALVDLYTNAHLEYRQEKKREKRETEKRKRREDRNREREEIRERLNFLI